MTTRNVIETFERPDGTPESGTLTFFTAAPLLETGTLDGSTLQVTLDGDGKINGDTGQALAASDSGVVWIVLFALDHASERMVRSGWFVLTTAAPDPVALSAILQTGLSPPAPAEAYVLLSVFLAHVATLGAVGTVGHVAPDGTTITATDGILTAVGGGGGGGGAPAYPFARYSDDADLDLDTTLVYVSDGANVRLPDALTAAGHLFLVVGADPDGGSVLPQGGQLVLDDTVVDVLPGTAIAVVPDPDDLDGAWIAAPPFFTDPTDTDGDILMRAGGRLTAQHIGAAGAVLTAGDPGGGVLPLWQAVLTALGAQTVGSSETPIPHGMLSPDGSPYTPQVVLWTPTSAGHIWQSTPPDADNLYLTASADGCTALVYVR